MFFKILTLTETIPLYFKNMPYEKHIHTCAHALTYIHGYKQSGQYWDNTQSLIPTH